MAILSYDIGVTGLKSIDAAFAHVERRARASNRMLLQGALAAQRQGRAYTTSVGTASVAARAARAQAMTEEQVRAEVARRGAALRERLAARTAARIAKIEASAAAKTEAEKTALAKAAETARVRHAERLARIEAASKARMAAASSREELRIQARARAREMAAERTEAAQKLAIARRVNLAAVAERKAMQGTVGRAAVGSVASIGRSAIGAAALAGTALVGSAIYTQSSEAFRAAQLANQAGTPERKGEILANAQRVQGFTGMEALEGLGKFTDLTGDLAAGEAMLQELGATALATGTSLEDLASAAGNAFIPLKDNIDNAEERAKALKTTIRAMAGMGAVGAVEVKDLAAEMAGLAAQATKFDGGTERVMQIAVAMAQTSRQRGGSSSAAEAVTSVERFGSDVLNKQGKLRQMGVEVFTDKTHTKMRGQDQIVMDVLDATGGDLAKLTDIFGERSIRAIQGFSPLYAQAERQKKGSGRGAVAAEFARLQQATLSDEAVRERSASLMDSPGMQFKETMKQLNAEIGREFTPIMLDLARSARDAVPSIVMLGKGAAAVARWFTENPLRGIGTVVAAKVTADIAAAAIGQAVQQAIIAQIAAAGAAGVAGKAGAAAAGAGTAGSAGAAGAGAGALALGGAGAAALAAVAGAGYEAYGLTGNIRGGAGQVGADDLTLGSAANALMFAGLFGAVGAKAGGASWGEAAQELTPVKAAQWFFGEAAFNGSQAGQAPDSGQTPPGAPPVAQATPAAAQAPAQGDQLSKPAQELTMAARALTDAAKAQAGLNRGPSPSPVK